MAYKKDIMEYYGLDRNDYVKGKSFYASKDGEKIGPRDLFNKITYNVSELLNKIVVSTLSKNEPKIVINVSDENSTEMVHVETKYYASLGRCYSIQLSDKIIQYGIISVEFETNIDVYVYFGHPGQFMHVNTKSKVNSRVIYFLKYIDVYDI